MYNDWIQKIGGTRFVFGALCLVANVVVVFRAPTVVDNFGVITLGLLATVVTGKTWHNIQKVKSNGGKA